MKGTLIAFDESTHSGKISGHDGKRYNFTRSDWTESKPPTKGLEVDFDVDGNNAKDLILVKGGTGTGEKSKTTAILLCLFLGAVGAHRFYVGKTGTAVLQLFTLGGLGVWAIIDLIMIIIGSFKDKEGNQLT